MNRLMDIANKSLTIMALAVFPLTAAVNGGYERILEIENQRKNEIIERIVSANIKELTLFDVRSVEL